MKAMSRRKVMPIRGKGFYTKELREFDRLVAIFEKDPTAQNAARLLHFQANTKHGQWPGNSRLVSGAVETMATYIMQKEATHES